MANIRFSCRFCNQPLEAPNDMERELIDCPACKKTIEIPAIRHEVPIKPPSAMSTPPQPVQGCYAIPPAPASARTSPKETAAIAGCICFGLGIAFMFLSLATFFIYVPLFLVAFILSIVAMARGRIATGIILLLLTLVVPPGLGFGLAAFRFSSALNEMTTDKRDSSAKIEFEDVESQIDGNYMYCTGKVRNKGDKPVRYVKVAVEWLDNEGTVLDTDYAYAVSGENLHPRGAKSFSIMTPRDDRMTKFRYWVVKE